MEVNQISKVSADLNKKAAKIKLKEDKTLGLFQKNIGELSKAVIYLKENREALCRKLGKLSTKRLKNFELVRNTLQIIRINEKKVNKINNEIQSTNEKETFLKNQYNSLLSGVTPQILDQDTGKLMYNIYSSNKKLDKRTNALKNDELLIRKRFFMEELETSFKKLEKELKSIESRRSNLETEKDRIKEIIYKTNKKHSTIQKEYAQQISEIKKTKKEIRNMFLDESAILSDYSKLLSSVQASIQIPKEVNIKLLPIASRLYTENETNSNNEENEWIVEIEDVSSDNNLISFPNAG